jgi:hypothetical protein
LLESIAFSSRWVDAILRGCLGFRGAQELQDGAIREVRPPRDEHCDTARVASDPAWPRVPEARP